MLTYVFNQSYLDCVRDPAFRQDIEDRLTDALIQSDFGVTDVELRFKDITMFNHGPHILGHLATKLDYIVRFNSSNEIEVRGEELYQKCRYTFMNSIPENYDETQPE